MKKIFAKIARLAAVIIVTALLSAVFTGAIQATLLTLIPGIPDSTLFNISGTLGIGFAAATLCLIIRYNSHLRFYRCPRRASATWSAAFIIFTLAACRIVLPGIWAYASAALGIAATESNNAFVAPLWEKVIFGVMIAPMAEELLFRKGLFSLLLRSFPAKWVIGITALMFAVIHGYNAEGFTSCLLAGTLFAIIMYRTGSIWLCIAAHMLCNLESLFYNHMEERLPSLIVNLDRHTTYCLPVFIAGLLIMLLSGAYILRREPRL